jgi:prepilin-type N-terminal cleavage/methylation domain-containing protein
LKNHNPVHHRNHFNHSSDRGFSLVELLVVVSIVAILSVSSVIGFGHLGNTLKAKEAAGFISDVVKQEELKILRGDFDKAVIHFLPSYLVIEEWPTEAVETLSLGSACALSSTDYQITYSAGNLTQKDGEGEVIQVRPVTASSECIYFKASEDLEWNYQLVSGEQSSATFRFAHFNLQRDSDPGNLSILGNVGARVEIRAPYGRKGYFKNDGKSADSLIIDVGNVDENVRESITLQ